MTLNQQKVIQIEKNLKLMCSKEQITEATDKLAVEITKEFENKDPIVLCIMTGAFIACSEICLRLPFPLRVDYVHASRYGGHTTGSKDLIWRVAPRMELEDRNVLIVDDILDEGLTLSAIKGYCESQNAKSVSTCVLFDKHTHPRKEGGLKKADFTGLNIDDKFVVGCGLDYHDYFRNLNQLYEVAKEDQHH